MRTTQKGDERSVEIVVIINRKRTIRPRIEDQATLQERNRIAREIHDGLGHTLAAQTIQINHAILFWQSDPPQALIFLKEAKQLGAAALLEVRKSVSMLRTPCLTRRNEYGPLSYPSRTSDEYCETCRCNHRNY
ncbi:sensor histidine kinase [Alkalinema pantanalense CENA528]|uniref:sensor histidine kinase n=1 Tax=Alkalinema pantanalense TaxID=1620705 RepID=UPI003D6F923C